ncbi:MAG: hypothetical protein AAB368_04535 [bacterium]
MEVGDLGAGHGIATDENDDGNDERKSQHLERVPDIELLAKVHGR